MIVSVSSSWKLVWCRKRDLLKELLRYFIWYLNVCLSVLYIVISCWRFWLNFRVYTCLWIVKPFPYGLDIVIKKYRRTGASNVEVRENHFYLFIEDRGVYKTFPFFTDVVVISTVVRLLGQEDLTQRTCCLCH